MVSAERKAKEGDLLQRHKEMYDGFKEAFQEQFVENLSRLMSMEEYTVAVKKFSLCGGCDIGYGNK